jgi:hypothetical protein
MWQVFFFLEILSLKRKEFWGGEGSFGEINESPFGEN